MALPPGAKIAEGALEPVRAGRPVIEPYLGASHA